MTNVSVAVRAALRWVAHLPLGQTFSVPAAIAEADEHEWRARAGLRAGR